MNICVSWKVKRMMTNKEKPINQRDITDDGIAYLEALKELNIGRLASARLETLNTELISDDYDRSEYGTLSGSYAESHTENIEEIDIVPAAQERLNQEYYEKHNESIDEPVIQMSNQHSKSIGSDIQPEENHSESRIPFDVQVKMAFLEKRTVRCCGSCVFLYKDDFGYFEEQNEASLHIAIRESISSDMDLKLTKHKIADVVHRIVSSPELQVDYEEFNSQVHLINFRNGVYDINTRTSLRHNPAYLFTSFIDAEYGDHPSRIRVYRTYSNGRSANQGYYFMKFLEDCTEGDPLKIKSLQQLTGYIISNEWRAKKFFVLIGLPHTGKSVWLALWRSLIGSKHTTAMSLKQLGETRFMTAELFKSKLNISAEMDENGSIKATDVIKTLTGSDLLTAEKKGKDPFQFYGKTKLVAAGNYMPLLNKLDGTSAFTDRILFLMFNNTIPEEKRDKSLMDKLMNGKRTS